MKIKITETIQRIVVDILEEFMFCKTIEEVISAYNRVAEKYEIMSDPFTNMPCTSKEYSENLFEYEKQCMIEKYGHCDGLE